MKKIATFALLLAAPAAVFAGTGGYSAPPGFETPTVRQSPIAGIRDKNWFNYRADINEADKELTSDLGRASDREDTWDAWDEWANELVDADHDYVKKMRKKGYRAGRVTVGG